MIRLADVTARSRGGAKVELGPLTFAIERGSCTALVGAPRDGAELFLELLAGVTAPRKGTVMIDGTPASPRTTLAYVSPVPDLPTALDVDEYLQLAGSVRGEAATAPRERLALLGVAPLARRRICDLSLEETRTVALVEALTSRAPLLLLAEPLVDLDPRAVGHIESALKARVSAGATAIFATASPEGARSLSRDLLVLDRGKIKKRTDADPDWTPPVGSHGACIFIRSEGARLLLAELAADPTFSRVQGEGATLVVHGQDPIAMATAVMVAARRANVELDQVTFRARDDEA